MSKWLQPHTLRRSWFSFPLIPRASSAQWFSLCQTEFFFIRHWEPTPTSRSHLISGSFFSFFSSPAFIQFPSSVRHQARLWGHKEELPSSRQKSEPSQNKGEGADDEQIIITQGGQGSVRGGVGSFEAQSRNRELAVCQALCQCFSALFYLTLTILLCDKRGYYFSCVLQLRIFRPRVVMWLAQSYIVNRWPSCCQIPGFPHANVYKNFVVGIIIIDYDSFISAVSVSFYPFFYYWAIL